MNSTEEEKAYWNWGIEQKKKNEKVWMYFRAGLGNLCPPDSGETANTTRHCKILTDITPRVRCIMGFLIWPQLEGQMFWDKQYHNAVQPLQCDLDHNLITKDKRGSWDYTGEEMSNIGTDSNSSASPITLGLWFLEVPQTKLIDIIT